MLESCIPHISGCLSRARHHSRCARRLCVNHKSHHALGVHVGSVVTSEGRGTLYLGCEELLWRGTLQPSLGVTSELLRGMAVAVGVGLVGDEDGEKRWAGPWVQGPRAQAKGSVSRGVRSPTGWQWHVYVTLSGNLTSVWGTYLTEGLGRPQSRSWGRQSAGLHDLPFTLFTHSACT